MRGMRPNAFTFLYSCSHTACTPVPCPRQQLGGYKAIQIGRDQICWSRGARWLGVQPTAEGCMEAVRGNSDCNDQHFGYAFGGDRNCACFEW